jgi:AcrR family transcriptional regulator
VTEERQARKRDSAASKTALLDAAAEIFAERGYDRATVRDIASQAGVNQALLFRYFGSKEALFAAVVARTGRDQLAESPPAELFARILRAILDKDRAASPDHVLRIMLRSSGEDVAATSIRRQIGDDYVHALAGLSDSPDADLRAHLVLAWIVGIDLLRSVAASPPLADADTEQVVQCVLPAVRTLLERAQDVSPE